MPSRIKGEKSVSNFLKYALLLVLVSPHIKAMYLFGNNTEYRFPLDRTFFSIENPNGSIEISTADQPYLQVFVWKWAAHKEDLPKIYADMRWWGEIKTRQVTPLLQAYINYKIIAPRNSSLNFNVQTESGNVEISKVMGNISAASLSGKINVRKILGAVQAKSLAGAITAEKVSGVCNLTSVSGKVLFINDFVTAPLTIQTISSNISVRSRILDAVVRAKTDVGQISTDTTMTVIPQRPTGYAISSTLWAGTNLVTLETVGGNISILKP